MKYWALDRYCKRPELARSRKSTLPAAPHRVLVPSTRVPAPHNSNSAQDCTTVRALVHRLVAQVRCNWDWVRDCRTESSKTALELAHCMLEEPVRRRVLRWYKWA